jgi:hypothetical protein
MPSRLRVRPALLAAATLAVADVAAAQAPAATRWGAGGSATDDFRVVVDSAVARGGRASLRLSADEEPGGYSGVSTALPGAPWAGRRVRVSAYLRTAALGGQGAALWARADTAGAPAAFTTTQGRRFLGGTLDWTPVSIELDVPARTSTILLGALTFAQGTLWVDDVRIEVVGAGEGRVLGFEPTDSLFVPPPRAASAAGRSPREAPRPLVGRALDNVVAFTRLAGYVRFFHPSDPALATNWDEFTVRGMRAVEKAPTADSLAATLRALFAPVAPAVAVYRTGGRAPARPAAPSGDSLGVVFWQHFGFGVPAAAPGTPGTPGTRPSNVYRSVRRRVPAPGGRPPAAVPISAYTPDRTSPVPDPTAPFVADLGGGVSAAVPLALYTTAAAVDSLWRPAPTTERFTAADRATRLGDVALLWMVMQHFYPYFDVVRTDWSAALRRSLAQAAVDRGSEAFDVTLQRLVAALRDGHGSVYRSGTPQVVPDVRLGWIEGRVVVTGVGDSAAAAGVRRGDEVVAVDGRPVADALREIEGRTSGATAQWVRHVALLRLAVGLPGTEAVLRLRDPLAPRAPARDVRVRRVPGPVPAEPRPEKIAELRPGIFYVDLDRVTDADVQAAMPRLADATGIIFDMRGYPRQVSTPSLLPRLSDDTVRSARFQVPVVTRPDHQGMQFGGEGWTLPAVRPRLRARIAFLSGGGAISYAESTLGVVEENRLGEIVGEPSAGTNGNVNPFSLPGGYTVSWTGMRVQKRDGTPHHGVGIRPTVPVSPTLRGVRAGKDEVLERAIGVVSASRM